MDTIEINIKSNAPEVTQETTSLRQQVRELRKEMESCAVGSKEYNDALAKLATTTHDFKDQQEAIRNSAGDLGTALSNVQGVATGIVSGFSAVNAVMTLTGSNTEDLQKAMVSLQAGIALVQGMQGLEGLPKTINAAVTSLKSLFTATTKETAATGALATSQGFLATVTKGVSNAFKGLKTALLSSGIGGILVLIGALGTAMTALVGVIRNNLQAENEFKETNDKLNESFATQNEALDLQIKYMQADGASTQEIIEAKRKLVQQQKAETEAALANAQARLSQLKNDSAWTKFWHGENKVIKELEKETIPALQATLDKLNKQEANFTADLYVESKKASNAIKTDSESTTKVIVDNTKEVAEESKKCIDDVEKAAKESFKRIYEEYESMLGNIKTARESILSTNTVSHAISDIQAFGLIYGTDFNKLDKQLEGVMTALVSNAIDAGLAERDRLIAENAGDTEALDKIKEEYENFVKDIYKIVDNVPEDSGGAKVEAELSDSAKAISDKAKAISEEFTNRFNALNSLYKDGVISYTDYFDTLQKVQNDYLTATNNFEEEYVSKVSGSEQRVAELRYQYAIKPLEFQKEVGEKFLDELDGQIAGIENTYNNAMVMNDSALTTWDAKLNTWVGSFTTTLTERYKIQKQMLDNEYLLWDERNTKEVDAINEQLKNNMLTVEQKAQLNAQLTDLENERLLKESEYTANSKALHEEWIDSIHQVGFSSLDEFAKLTNALNAVSQAQVAEYKRLYESGKISKEKFEKLQNEELEKQAALQKATAIMQTAAGIATVWSQSAQLGPIAGPIIASIQTAAYIANMVAQLKSINTALRAGIAGDTSDSASAPDTSFTLTSPDAYQNTLSDEVQTDLQANAKDNQRVYVVSSDISNAQHNEKTTVTTATF